MSHPIFSEIPERYHDRVIVDPDGNATITVETGLYEVPVIYEADRAAMKLPPGLHRDRRAPDRPFWYPPVY
jgi:hypothetical protein